MRKHIGSAIALILGIISLASSLSNPSYQGGLLAGPVIILGALAYRSAKKRLLGEVKTTLLRKALEVLALIIIAAAVLLQNDLKNQITTEPVPNIIIPLWVIVAYIIIASKKATRVE
ncbi:MAG TPA: hypothetical protein VIE69_02915 [Methylophilaceae bacterium]|jgi:membrane protease YdiL (CAAX protease family)